MSSEGGRRLRLAVVVVGLVAGIAAAAAIPVRSSHGAQLTGDEPHYLLTALSLAEDGDLDIAEAYAEERYRPFHEIPLDPQGLPLEDGRVLAPHDPGLPALLVLPAHLGGWVGARAALALAAGVLAGLLVWTAVRRLGAPLLPAAVVVGLFGASAPFAVYGAQVYPEILAALAVAAGVAALTGPLSRGGLAVAVGSVVALPWLSVKYAPVAAVLAAAALVLLWRRERLGEAAGLCVALGAAGIVFLVLHQLWYGGWTPYAAGEHFVRGGELSVVGYAPDFAGRSVRLVGFLVDRRFGIAAWQPLWLAVVPAAAALLRGRPARWGVLAGTLACGWLVATFVALTMHGWWFAGRQLVVVLPVAVLAVAWWVGASTRRLLGAAVPGLLGVIAYGWLVAEGWGQGITWAVDFFGTGNPWYAFWSSALPDYMARTQTTWVLHGVWVAGMGALALWGWASGRPEGEGGRPSGDPLRTNAVTVSPSR